MPIQPLGKEAALLLRASALVVTPVSLVKELVDNAIDAKSTTIKVQIARNGVDQIEVQDNGVGIHADDFGALGRRAHTSKLREFQDLPRVGGRSLGFRGEALAAANSFAEVTITTRTSGEMVGHRVRLERKEGGVKKHDFVPAPVGTTVRIQHLFDGIPVRKRMAVENFQKSTAGMKHLLTTYALARPHIRISFCVLGEPRGSWSYSPVGAPTVREAVFQIFGNDLATQCVRATLVETTSSPHDKLIEELTDHEISRITVDAFLPMQDADLSAICGKGTFISVDGRPMAPGRGVMKKIVSMFKARLDSLCRRQGARSRLSNVFIQLDIRCPPGSYDINLSPAKDEVMFTDEPRVLKVIEELLDVSYALAEPERAPGGSNAGELDGLTPEDLQALESFAIGDDNSSVLDPLNPSLDDSERDSEVVPFRNGQLGCPPDEGTTAMYSSKGNVKPETVCLIDMSTPCDDDDVPQTTVTSVIDQLQRTAVRRVQKQNDEADILGEDEGESPPTHSMRSNAPGEKSRLPGPFTPVADYPNPWTIAAKSAGVKQERHFLEVNESGPALDDSESDDIAAPVSQPSCSRAIFPISPSRDTHQDGSALCTPPRTLAPPQLWALQTPPPSDTRKPVRQRGILPCFKPLTLSAPRGRQLEATHPRERPQHGQRHIASLDREILEPLYIEHQAESLLPWDSCMGPTNLTPLQHPNTPGLPDPFMSPPLVSVADISTGDVPAFRRVSRDPTLETNGLGVLEAGRRSIMDGSITDESSNQSDPRKYLMKRRRSISRDRRAGRVLRRMKSALLPLEAIPVGLEMHTASLDVSTSHTDIRSSVFNLIHIDGYVSTGTSKTGLPDDLEGATDAQHRIQTLFEEWLQKTTGTRYDLKLNLRSQVKGKSSC